MNENLVLLDPTAETSPARRQRRTPPPSLDDVAIGLLDIGKARGDIFVDQLDKRLTERGFAVKRYAKPTNTKVAPVALAQRIAGECGVVVEALSD